MMEHASCFEIFSTSIKRCLEKFSTKLRIALNGLYFVPSAQTRTVSAPYLESKNKNHGTDKELTPGWLARHVRRSGLQNYQR